MRPRSDLVRWYRAPRVWLLEVVLVAVPFGFHALAPVWSFWTEGEQINGVIVAADAPGEGGHWTTIRDAETGGLWEIHLSNNNDVGDVATAYYLPSDPSKTASPGELQLGLAVLVLAVMAPLVWPVLAWRRGWVER